MKEQRRLALPPLHSTRRAKRSLSGATDEGLSEINEPNYSKHDDDRGETETEDIADIMSCYTLTGFPRRHDGAMLWAARRGHDRLPIANEREEARLT
jgi:hypothetical protein